MSIVFFKFYFSGTQSSTDAIGKMGVVPSFVYKSIAAIRSLGVIGYDQIYVCILL